MPSRGRAKGRKSDSNLNSFLLRSAIELPQELIDAIIDEFDISRTDANNSKLFPDRKALRSCALVARAFVRPSQTKLFSAVNLTTDYYGPSSSPDKRVRLFSKLLSSAPHIRSYVRTLLLSYRCARSASVVSILSSLPRLQSLSLKPWFDLYSNPGIPDFPVHLREPFLAIFSTASLRRLELRNHRFEHPQELQDVLSSSVNLKELLLRRIEFADISPRPSESNGGTPRVVLESLEILYMRLQDVDAVLNSFTVVNITNLRFIGFDRHHASLLRVNAQSIHNLTLVVFFSSEPFAEALDRVLPAKTSLNTLSLKMRATETLPAVIRGLGNLANLKALHRISITAVGKFAPEWSFVDSRLAEVGSELKELHLNLTDYEENHEGIYRRLMPRADAKGILRISSATPGSELAF
ncbi:hypothetical protein FB451DRAFT_1289572 [Mycena latifolia]|nr:hypothetical protein FB451DRAFT_1289572 [Mycena latifolia]